MSATFRPATADDVPLVASIIDRAYEHYIPILGGRKPRPMTDDHAARIGRGETSLMEDDGTPVGVVSLSLEGDALHIFNVAILPAAQGRGLLRQLFAFAEARARGAGARRLTLYTNALMERNRTIYSHIGFTEVRQEDVPGGYRVVFFERPIAG
jgi:N-acetylglutamate synthase-like GNAT family acetyltransferase